MEITKSHVNNRICQHCGVKTCTVTPSFYYVFNMSLSCNINIPSFIKNLWWDLLLGNHLKHFPCFCYRCHAAWDYILQLSKDTSDNQIMSENVLYIIEEICSSSQGKMPPGVKEIVQQFTKSEFFKSIFPIFVESTAKGSCYRY